MPFDQKYIQISDQRIWVFQQIIFWNRMQFQTQYTISVERTIKLNRSLIFTQPNSANTYTHSTRIDISTANAGAREIKRELDSKRPNPSV